MRHRNRYFYLEQQAGGKLARGVAFSRASSSTYARIRINCDNKRLVRCTNMALAQCRKTKQNEYIK
jgi:hypothetical protein